MRKIVYCLGILLPFAAIAQTNKPSLYETFPAAKEVQQHSRLVFPTQIKFDQTKAPVAIGDHTTDVWAKGIFPLRSSDRLVYDDQYTSSLTSKTVHYKFHQEYNNIPVEFSMIRVHEREGKIVMVNGEFNPDITTTNSISINAEQALNFAKQAVPAKSYKWERKAEEAELKVALNKPDFSYDPKTKLVIFPIGNGAHRTFRYAYKLDIYAHEPDERYNIYIDAETGELLRKIPTMCTIDVKGVAHTKYHGILPITADSNVLQNVFHLKETNRKGRGMQIETRDCNTGSENMAEPFVDLDNIWNNVNAQMDEAATDCHVGAEMTYDYYLDSLERDSYDDNGAKLLQYVHFSQNWFNAQWTGSYSRYGDGNGAPLTSIDVVSHEITHGVTQETAGLIYELESGALNESFSDIFGTAVEFTQLGAAKSSWIIGTSSFALRDMSNPNAFGNPDTYEGNLWTDTKNCSPNNGNDYCGVHNNSGVQNYWFYLLSAGGSGVNDKGDAFEVAGIGIPNAAKIAYINLRDYLTYSSDYVEARNGSVNAAIDMFGFNSQQAISTMNAWHAVGLGKPYSFLPKADFDLVAPACAPNFPVAFKNMSGSGVTYFWDFGDGQSSFEENPVHTYSSTGSYNVTLIVINPNGSDTITKNNFVQILSDGPVISTCNNTVKAPFSTGGIYRVQLAQIDKSSLSPLNEDGYQDFTCSRAYLKPGSSNPIEVTTFVTTAVFTRVYIDWNNNGTFEPSTELVMATNNTVQNHTGIVEVPANAVMETPLRMRVISGRANLNTPDAACNDIRNGQIEDYSVTVTNNIVGVNNEKISSFNVYPNPVNDILIVTSLNKQNVSVKMIDMLGKVVYQNEFKSEAGIDVSSFTKGIYTLELVTPQGKEYKKVIIN